MNDILSDTLTRIRNGQMASHAFVEVLQSKFVLNALKLLEVEGYIAGYKEFEEDNKKRVKVALKYHKGKPVINKLIRISKPGHKIYTKVKNIPFAFNGLGVIAVSTPKGIVSDKEARKLNLGGELLFKVL